MISLNTNPKVSETLEVLDNSMCSLDPGRTAFSALSINSVCGLSEVIGSPDFFHLAELPELGAKDEICCNSPEQLQSEVMRQDGQPPSDSRDGLRDVEV